MVVTLAGDGTKVLSQNQWGTIVIPEQQAEKVQPIVPLGALITELGCTLHWTQKELKLNHPRHGRIKVSLRGRCPELGIADALELIRELEERELRRLQEQVEVMTAKLDTMVEEDQRPWLEYMKSHMNSGRKEVMWRWLATCPYTQGLPEEVKELLLEGFEISKGKEYLKKLPLTRRQGRLLLSSSSWVVHMFSGEESREGDPFRVLPQHGRALLEIDIGKSKSWDLNLWAGRTSFYFGGLQWKNR